jgi:GT2 family glycosyltransferase
MFVPSRTLDAVGLLDSETFAPTGWGADIDYGLRVQSAGLSVVVTRLSYLHHEKSVTAMKAYAGGLEGYGREISKWPPAWPPSGATAGVSSLR